LFNTASEIEAEFYCKKNRLEELIEFSHRMDYSKLGLAFCIGLSEEVKVLADILKQHFEVISVCCKICGIDKQTFKLPQIKSGQFETMCNPCGQAEVLNNEKTDLNIICGLCIGHDIVFTEHSKAPVTTFLVKDRVLGHNPAVSLYSRYIRNRLIEKD
jgi:uncharacterized metal-binding protein